MMDIEERRRLVCDLVQAYMREAVVRIENEFGAGFAEQHPELIAGFLQAAIRVEVSYVERSTGGVEEG